MARKKVAPTALWQTGVKGARAEMLTLAYDADADEFYVASGEDADAFLVLDTNSDEYRVNDTRGGTMARIRVIGAAPGRVLE